MSNGCGPAPMRVGVRVLGGSGRVPERAHEGDAGLDLRSSMTVSIEPGGRAVVGTGVAVAIPEGFAGFVQPRSGLAVERGVTVLNSPGLIDPGYRGDVKVILVNHGDETVTVHRGMRVAQLVVVPVATVEPVEVDSLDGTARGEAGLGSTGTD